MGQQQNRGCSNGHPFVQSVAASQHKQKQCPAYSGFRIVCCYCVIDPQSTPAIRLCSKLNILLHLLSMYKYENKYIRVIPDLHNEKPTKPTATQSERILLLHSSTYHMPALHARPSLPMLLIYNSGQVHTYDRHRPCIRHLNLISQILLLIQVEAICWVYVCVWVDYVKWKIILIFWLNFRGNGQTLTLFPPQRRTTKIRAQRLKGKHSSRPSQFQVKYVGVCVWPCIDIIHGLMIRIPQPD